MFPTASTLMRPVVVRLLGTVIDSEPSLATPLASAIGYVLPPSVESRMFTLAVLIGATSVPATAQVTVWLVPAFHTVPPVLGLVTAKPVAPTLTVVTSMSSKFTPPRPSRATTRKFIARATVVSGSPCAVVLFSRFDGRGIVRVGLLVGSHVRTTGPVVPEVLLTGRLPPVSLPSHE